MNLKNLMTWGVIVLLVVGLFQLFQNPKKNMASDKMPFSEFVKNIEDGRVIQVEIKGNNIEGVLSDGTSFNVGKKNSDIRISWLLRDRRGKHKNWRLAQHQCDQYAPQYINMLKLIKDKLV